jgi:hypothetical protein
MNIEPNEQAGISESEVLLKRLFVYILLGTIAFVLSSFVLVYL